MAQRHILGLCLVLLVTSQLTQSSISKNKNKESVGRTREQYLSKSYGEIQFNKYKGQLPPKGSILGCSIQCMTLATCHCLALNIHTSECNFFDMDSSPDYGKWMSDLGNQTTGSADMAPDSNYTNGDFIFFTRDILDPTQPSKLDISKGRKMITSYILEPAITEQQSSQPQRAEKQDKKSSKSNKIKNNKNENSKSNKTKSSKNARASSTTTASTGTAQFPYPWIQIEFKDSMYLTEVALQTSRGIDDLKHFEIRVGDEPITKFYEDYKPPTSAAESSNETIQAFALNRLCFEYSSTSKGFFEFGAIRKQSSFVKSIKCRPCGLKGRFLTIQAMSPCTNCLRTGATNEENRNSDSGKVVKSALSKSTESSQLSSNIFPFAVSNIEVYGYAL